MFFLLFILFNGNALLQTDIARADPAIVGGGWRESGDWATPPQRGSGAQFVFLTSTSSTASALPSKTTTCQPRPTLHVHRQNIGYAPCHYRLIGLLITLTFDLWPWKLFQLWPLTWRIFLGSFNEIGPLRKKTSRPRTDNGRTDSRTDSRKDDRKT